MATAPIPHPLSDPVQVKADSPDIIVFHLHHRHGNGKIKLTSGTWPRKVVIRVHRCNLEFFRVSDGCVALQGSLATVHNVNPRVLRTIEHTGVTVVLRKDDPCWLVVERKSDHVDVVLPRAFLKDSPTELTLGWIAELGP